MELYVKWRASNDYPTKENPSSFQYSPLYKQYFDSLERLGDTELQQVYEDQEKFEELNLTPAQWDKVMEYYVE